MYISGMGGFIEWSRWIYRWSEFGFRIILVFEYCISILIKRRVVGSCQERHLTLNGALIMQLLLMDICIPLQYMKGLFRCCYLKEDFIMDSVPLDMCVNFVIAVAWKTAIEQLSISVDSS